MTLPSDEEMLSIKAVDPDLEQYRNFLREQRRAARQEFIVSHATLAEWETDYVDADRPAMNEERKQNAAVARQRKENMRTRFATFDALLAALPSAPKKESATTPVAREASKG